METLRNQAMEAMVFHDPQRAVDEALGLLLGYTRASAGALFALSAESPVLYCGRGLSQAHLDRAVEAWEDASESLVAGHSYTDTTWAVFPVNGPDDGGVLAGLLYLGSARHVVIDHQAVETLLPIFRAALRAARGRLPSSVDLYLEVTPVEEIEREQLRLLLQRHEWNIARVARIKNCTRATIYEQMKRWGIERQKIPKRHRRLERT